MLAPEATVPWMMPTSSLMAVTAALVMLGNTSRSSVKGLAKPTTPLRPAGVVPPLLESPQETTVPSLFRAAKATPLEKIWVTPPSPAGVVPP